MAKRATHVEWHGVSTPAAFFNNEYVRSLPEFERLRGRSETLRHGVRLFLHERGVRSHEEAVDAINTTIGNWAWKKIPSAIRAAAREEHFKFALENALPSIRAAIRPKKLGRVESLQRFLKAIDDKRRAATRPKKQSN